MKNEKLKIKNLLIIFLVLFVLTPFLVQAAGLVPCGGEKEPPCELCDLFVMLDRIIDFFLLPPTGIVPIVATLMLVIGGIMFFAAAGNPGNLKTAKDLLTSVVIGLIIIYGAWIFINTFFIFIGVADWTGLKGGWFSFSCP